MAAFKRTNCTARQASPATYEIGALALSSTASVSVRVCTAITAQWASQKKSSLAGCLAGFQMPPNQRTTG